MEEWERERESKKGKKDSNEIEESIREREKEKEKEREKEWNVERGRLREFNGMTLTIFNVSTHCAQILSTNVRNWIS